MKWTEEDKQGLLAFKSVKLIDDDNIKGKETIKKVLLNNKYIIHVLNNKKLEEANSKPDDYYGECILPYFIIEPVQTDSKNFICFEIQQKQVNKYNGASKPLLLTFYILCEQKNIVDADTGLARHDLLAALIKEQFNFTNYIGGGKIELISDVPSTTDNNYATRTLVFQQITDNNLVKTRKYGDQYISKLANKEIHQLGKDTD